MDYDPRGTLRELQLILISPHTELLKATARSQPIPFPTRVLLSVDGTVATPHRTTPSVEVHGMKGGARMAPLRDGQWSASRSCRLNLLNRWVGGPHSMSGFFCIRQQSLTACRHLNPKSSSAQGSDFDQLTTNTHTMHTPNQLQIPPELRIIVTSATAHLQIRTRSVAAIHKTADGFARTPCCCNRLSDIKTAPSGHPPTAGYTVVTQEIVSLQAMKAYRGRRCIAPLILNLSSSRLHTPSTSLPR